MPLNNNNKTTSTISKNSKTPPPQISNFSFNIVSKGVLEKRKNWDAYQALGFENKVEYFLCLLDKYIIPTYGSTKPHAAMIEFIQNNIAYLIHKNQEDFNDFIKIICSELKDKTSLHTYSTYIKRVFAQCSHLFDGKHQDQRCKITKEQIQAIETAKLGECKDQLLLCAVLIERDVIDLIEGDQDAGFAHFIINFYDKDTGGKTDKDVMNILLLKARYSTPDTFKKSINEITNREFLVSLQFRLRSIPDDFLARKKCEASLSERITQLGSDYKVTENRYASHFKNNSCQQGKKGDPNQILGKKARLTY